MKAILNNKAFIIVTAIVLVLLLAVNIVATQVTLVTNTFNTIFGEERRVLRSGDPDILKKLDREAEALQTAGKTAPDALAFHKLGDYRDAQERSAALWRDNVKQNESAKG